MSNQPPFFLPSDSLNQNPNPQNRALKSMLQSLRERSDTQGGNSTFSERSGMANPNSKLNTSQFSDYQPKFSNNNKPQEFFSKSMPGIEAEALFPTEIPNSVQKNIFKRTLTETAIPNKLVGASKNLFENSTNFQNSETMAKELFKHKSMEEVSRKIEPTISIPPLAKEHRDYLNAQPNHTLPPPPKLPPVRKNTAYSEPLSQKNTALHHDSTFQSSNLQNKFAFERPANNPAQSFPLTNDVSKSYPITNNSPAIQSDHLNYKSPAFQRYTQIVNESLKPQVTAREYPQDLQWQAALPEFHNYQDSHNNNFQDFNQKQGSLNLASLQFSDSSSYSNQDPWHQTPDPHLAPKEMSHTALTPPTLNLFTPSKLNSRNFEESVDNSEREHTQILRSGHEKDQLSEENTKDRTTEAIEQLHYIQQSNPTSVFVLQHLLDGQAHAEFEILREIKKNRFMGSVAFGMLMYNLRILFGEEMVKSEEVQRVRYFSLSPALIDMIRIAFEDSDG